MLEKHIDELRNRRQRLHWILRSIQTLEIMVYELEDSQEPNDRQLLEIERLQKQLSEEWQEARLLMIELNQRRLSLPLLQLVAFLPEECIAEIGVAYHRMKKKNASPWEIRFRLTEEVASLLWGCVQVKLENLRLPMSDRTIDD